MIEIDGSAGEGGGQVLRAALSLSLVTGRPFRIHNIRAGREKPGLLRQHLAAVRAAAAVGAADVSGDAVGSGSLEFAPSAIVPGHHSIQVGTAGSTMLVLQAVLPALMVASEPSRLELEGGTHNPFAPPYDFFMRTLAPLLERMGPRLAPAIERSGFYPAGGGRITLDVQPASSLARFELMDKGDTLSLQACAKVANLGMTIADRELATLRAELRLEAAQLKAERIENTAGPGNVLTVEVRSHHVTELFTGFGRREVSSAQVALGVAREVRAYLEAGAPVGPYLADQLLAPMAIGAGGRFRTGTPTGHTRTAAGIVPLFVDADVHFEQESEQVWRVDVNVPRS